MDSLLEKINRAKKILNELTVEPTLIVIGFVPNALFNLALHESREQVLSFFTAQQSLGFVIKVKDYDVYSNYKWHEIPPVYQRLCLHLLSKNDEVVCFSAKIAELQKNNFSISSVPQFTFPDYFGEYMMEARYFSPKTS